MQHYFHSNPLVGTTALLAVVASFIYLLVCAPAVAQCISTLDCLNLP